MTTPPNKTLVDQRLEVLTTHQRIRLLYYMIWVHQQSDLRGPLWTRRPGRMPPTRGDQMEFDQFERAYLRLGDDFPVEDKKFLHRLTAAQQRLKRCPTTDHNINRGIEILNKRLQAVRHAKDKFLRDTDSIDIFSTQEGRADLMSQINVPGLGSAGATDGKSVPFSSRQGADSSSLSLLIEPLTVWRKLHYEYHLCEKRFAVIVSESSNAPPSLGPLAYRLANELLLLISEQFNRLYDFPYVYAKIQLALFILCGFLICLPYSFPFHMLRYLSCFLFTLYLSFIYTEISQNLWTVCREVNAVTGRFGVCIYKERSRSDHYD